MLVDTHVHPVSGDQVKYPRVDGEHAWLLGRSLDAEAYVRDMRAAGVSQAVLVNSFDAYGHDNSYCADAARTDVHRFASVCRVDPLAPDAPAMLDYWIEQRAMHGLRLASSGTHAYPLIERAAELGVPVALWVRWAQIGDIPRLAA